MSDISRGFTVLTQNLWFNTSRNEKWDSHDKLLNVVEDEEGKNPSNWPSRCSAFQKWLGLLMPDVICLQEVLQGNGIDMLKDIFDDSGELASVYKYRAFYHASNWWKDKNVSFGNAIVSRYPIINRFEIILPQDHGSSEKSLGPEKETRSALTCWIKHPTLGTICVTTTHFNWRLHHSFIRLEQAVVLAAFIKKNHVPGFPAIVTGDFNAKPIEPCIRYLSGELSYESQNFDYHEANYNNASFLSKRYPDLSLRKSVFFVDAWKRAGRGSDGDTWSNYNINTNVHLDENKRLDYIFVSPPNEDGVGLVEETRVVCDHVFSPSGAFPSDHFGVLTELRTRPSLQISRAKY